ncbi:MAG TPA: transketolase, partial [Solirubrobacterales bacterium]|nr:transketolase [Solirubrobacterales bacterium]
AAAGSGHPTSSMSAADLLAVLLDGHLRLDPGNLDDPSRDHLIFSKGHASPLYYAVLKAAGIIDDAELLTFRRLGSRLEGHPTPRIPPTDVATGSLGQGLPISVGVAMTGKRLDRLPYRVWCLCGDSEMAEGSMWEAFQHAGWEGLDNIVAIVDVNRLGQTRETMLGWDMDGYAERVRAFGWNAIVIDGHDVDEIEAAYAEAEATEGRPTAVLARTKKGRGVKAVEDQPGKHGKPLDDPEGAIAELGGERDLTVRLAPPVGGSPHTFEVSGGDVPSWELGEEVATRKAYGESLAALGGIRGDVVALDGEVSNSTHSEDFREDHEDRYFEMFIAEQQLVAAAIGMQVRDWVPFASTFAAFFSRAYDFVRMGAISRANLRLAGSHAGVSIGEDGPSQMALEDMAAFRAIHGSTVLHPSDANQTAALVAAMADNDGIQFLRTLRGKTPVRTPEDETVRIGGSRVVRGADADDVAIVACGITVGEADRAAEALERDGIRARVLDCYSVKPMDADAVRAAAHDCGALVTVEDHWPEGGIGETVAGVLAEAGASTRLVRLAVSGRPGSGPPASLLSAAGIDAAAIVAATEAAIERSPA